VKLSFEPALVASGEDGEGRLVYRGDYLVAVLVRLSAAHEAEAGGWFLEKGFGPLDGPNPPTFAGLDEARAWIAAQLAHHFDGKYWP
jgi:hypothetical protein